MTFGQRTVDDMSFAWMKFLYLTDEDWASRGSPNERPSPRRLNSSNSPEAEAV